MIPQRPGGGDQVGPYVLRPLLEQVPLSEDGSQGDVRINCVEYYDGNLYVGTSASEVLHFVRIPPDPADKNGAPMFISASRTSPYSDPSGTSKPGVQQIMLLPRIGKACILCNGTVSFYSLPELSPAFGSTQARNCNWIGGIDLNESLIEASDEQNTVTIMLSLQRKINVVRMAEDARPQLLKEISFPGSRVSARRESIACVADSKSYSLLDVNRKLMIPLMSISSLDAGSTSQIGHTQTLPTETSSMQRSSSLAEPRSSSHQSHSRTSSLGGSILDNLRRHEPTKHDHDDQSIGGSPQRFASPQPPEQETNKALPPVPGEPTPELPTSESKTSLPSGPLRPHIASPTPEEFLLVVGTGPNEVGIGMFVSVDGDTTRPTIEFESYPNEVVLDGIAADPSMSQADVQRDDDCFVIASLSVEDNGQTRHGLEIQRWDAGSEAVPEKHWIAASEGAGQYGIKALLGTEETMSDSIITKLSERRFHPFPSSIEASTASLKSVDSRTAMSMERLAKERELFERDSDSHDGDSVAEGWEATRISDGEEFTRRLSKINSNIAVWSQNQIWWAVRNPLLLQLDARLESAISAKDGWAQAIDSHTVFSVLSSIKERDATSELEFLTLRYIQQKAGILLLSGLLVGHAEQQFSDGEIQILESILMESQLDPRVVLSFIPGLRNEILQARQGIWVYNGIKLAAEAFLQSRAFEAIAKGSLGNLESQILHFLRRFLGAWRKRKGFGSVSDEKEVFGTVEASLLCVLLELDRPNLKNPNHNGAIRAELNDFVNKGVDSFDRAISLLEGHHRLFMLSRLYQSRKMSADVLATWRRIIEGEQDDGNELVDGELRVREYLTKIGNQSLVRQYGIWLAQRNPKLGVQVFTEDKGKAPKFEPTEAVEILKEEAPDAVKYYLEHLTFGKGHTAYVNELITYYLDVVIADLQKPASRDAIMAAYDAYRALQAPKPTYHHFLEENSPENDEVWESRLRLLQLLGGANDYDSAAIRKRIASLPDDLLVPETVILASRENNHKDALRLLVQKLGDYDSALSYCLRGSASLFSTAAADSLHSLELAIELQRNLFNIVLREFLVIEDTGDRIEQTGSLLARFGGWFDVAEVLEMIPDSWPVETVAGFLVGTIRRIVRDKREAMVAKALSRAQNLRASAAVIEEICEKGPIVQDEAAAEATA